MAEDKSPIRVLEFYSGIGGLRYSLEKSGVKADLVEAFDINELANDVYEHNFGHRPTQGNIQGLTVQQLDKYKADSWLMSPPCQPYTRQGLQKDADDARASSFLKIMELLPLMASPPAHVLVENVVGFENSVTHSRLLAVLEDAGFVIQEFILSPLQFGIPYSRPRYFCLAKTNSEDFVEPGYNGQLLCSPGPLLHLKQTQSNSHIFENVKDSKKTSGLYSKSGNGTSLNDLRQVPGAPPIQLKRNEPIINPAVQCGTVGDYLESIPVHAMEEGIGDRLAGPSSSDGNSPALTSASQCSLHQDSGLPGRNIVGDPEQANSNRGQSTSLPHGDQWEPYKVPMNVVERWIDAYDIVTPQCRRCCCFTKSYSRYAKGTGSFLATKVSLKEEDTLEKHIFDLRLEGRSLASLGLRYFTPREVANLHSFPDSFRFPAHIKLKQRYALLGNSLSVAVVGSLIKYLFSTRTLREPLVGQ
ncbi:unnamed protein product [Calypogeia fissa]